MKTIACTTLGCKVNEYDTQAMRELFENAGWQSVPFDAEADVYLVNTCTVTSTGDSKSMKAVRRVLREHPGADVIVTGCLAQKDAQGVCLPGVRLVIGNARRSEVVSLYEQAKAENTSILAVGDLKHAAFEPLHVTKHEDRTRAVMKIQEGCNRYCTYCIIPYVRGPVRSMPIAEIRAEARRLADAGYREIVLTGIHMASYADGNEGSLACAIAAVCDVENVARVRLGSLEPCVVTEEFLKAVSKQPKLCPQFHLALQSGSETVLQRMHRRYTAEEYARAAEMLREAFPGCAITTDVLTGFPGETEEEAAETERFVERIGFARIHVFPYSKREGTLAARMPGQLTEACKHERARRLIELGNQLEERYVLQTVGTVQQVLFENECAPGVCEGYTPYYVRVRARAVPGSLVSVRVTGAEGKVAFGEAYSDLKEVNDR